MVVLKPFELFLGVAPDVADGHPGILRPLLDDLDEVPAAFLGERGERQPDDVAVVRGLRPRSEA